MFSKVNVKTQTLTLYPHSVLKLAYAIFAIKLVIRIKYFKINWTPPQNPYSCFITVNAARTLSNKWTYIFAALYMRTVYPGAYISLASECIFILFIVVVQVPARVYAIPLIVIYFCFFIALSLADIVSAANQRYIYKYTRCINKHYNRGLCEAAFASRGQSFVLVGGDGGGR